MTPSWMHFLRTLVPFLVTVVLWRAGAPFWNPAGILALIPVFYCSFVRPVPWFAPFAILVCFLIDYCGGTVLFWTALYLLIYAISHIQTYIDFTALAQDSHRAFMVFFGAAVAILFFWHPTFSNFLRGLWLWAWASTLYIPVTELIKRTRHD